MPLLLARRSTLRRRLRYHCGHKREGRRVAWASERRASVDGHCPIRRSKRYWTLLRFRSSSIDPQSAAARRIMHAGRERQEEFRSVPKPRFSCSEGGRATTVLAAVLCCAVLAQVTIHPSPTQPTFLPRLLRFAAALFSLFSVPDSLSLPSVRIFVPRRPKRRPLPPSKSHEILR